VSFNEVTSFIPTCDECGPDCWHAETDGPPHFLGANTAALAVLKTLYGWSVEQQDDGTFRMLCPDCTPAVCDRSGHDWYTAALDPAQPAPSRPVEICSRCCIVRRDHEPLDAPPAVSPEAATGLLSLIELAALAVIETHLTEGTT
jgi:hypothetical protein